MRVCAKNLQLQDVCTYVNIFVCLVAGIMNEKERLYGVQFHPEVDLSDNGVAMLKNFLRGIAECRATFTIKSREDVCIQYIQSAVGSHKVLVRTYIHAH